MMDMTPLAPDLPTHGNPEAEKHLLGAVMVHNAILDRVSNLRPEHFCIPLYERLFSACLRLRERQQPASPVTLAPLFKGDPDLAEMGGIAYLTRIPLDVPSPSEAPSYARTIIDAASRRKLAAILCQSLERACDGSYESTVEELTGRLIADVQAIEAPQSSDNIHNRREVMNAVVEDMRRMVQGDSTGLPKWDMAMGGAGLIPSRSYGIAARMKAGKTTLLGSVSYNLNERGIRHLYIAGEMSERELEQRNMARALKIDSLRFLQSSADRDLHISAAEYALKSKAEGTHYLTAPGITFDQLKRAFVTAVWRYKVRGVIFDYLQLVQGKPKGKSTAEFYDEVSQWIANYCRQEGIWSLVACQLNQDDNVRGGESLKFGFDQIYKLKRVTDDSPHAWLEMVASRYTGYMSVGSEEYPALFMEDRGPFFREA